MTKIFDDGVLEATLFPNHWVFVRWMQNNRGRLQKTLIRDLADMEKHIFKEKLLGWFTLSEVGHLDFHKLLEKFGAKPGIVDGPYQYFVKGIAQENDLHKRAVR